jgi:hypothetical protein
VIDAGDTASLAAFWQTVSPSPRWLAPPGGPTLCIVFATTDLLAAGRGGRAPAAHGVAGTNRYPNSVALRASPLTWRGCLP